ncbi:MAG: hypothetical protein PHY99_01040 [Bacteroidales bacterium]|nr:hypothetical protein [Bacteroidales bacterium]
MNFILAIWLRSIKISQVEQHRIKIADKLIPIGDTYKCPKAHGEAAIKQMTSWIALLLSPTRIEARTALPSAALLSMIFIRDGAIAMLPENFVTYADTKPFSQKPMRSKIRFFMLRQLLPCCLVQLVAKDMTPRISMLFLH